MTRILVVYYSQTGQLTRVVRSFMEPLAGRADVQIMWQQIEPIVNYPFPWKLLPFFDVFPEAVYLDPPAIVPPAIDPVARYDLVVLAYQVWFLSPSLPITAFLKSPAARVLADTPVITVIGCRNMWLSAQETVRALIAQRGGRLIDNVVLTDQGPPWATFVTTPRWMLTGKQNGFARVFPPAGISEQDIAGAARFGRALADVLLLLQSGPSGPLLQGLGAVRVNPAYIASERLAHRSFRIWGALLRAIGPAGHPVRRSVLIVYIVFLISLILIVVPLGVLLRALLRPLMRRRVRREVAHLEQPSGSGSERMAQYAEVSRSP